MEKEHRCRGTSTVGRHDRSLVQYSDSAFVFKYRGCVVLCPAMLFNRTAGGSWPNSWLDGLVMLSLWTPLALLDGCFFELKLDSRFGCKDSFRSGVRFQFLSSSAVLDCRVEV